MLHDNKRTLARYNSLFDNQQYSAIAERIAADLRVPCVRFVSRTV